MDKTDLETVGKKRLITAALPYINNVPHLGHIVGSHLPADIFARYCRSKGYDTLFVGGTDENGSASEIAAAGVGVDIEKFSAKLFEEHKKIYDWFGISYDNFSRTSKTIHHETTKEFFEKIKENGYIKEGSMKVFYSPKDERYLADRYVIGTCPECGYEEANGDQCEKCTAVLDSITLKNPRSTISGGDLEIKDSKHLFLQLDKLSDQLKSWIEEQTLWRKQVKNLALGWIKGGLRERCITRDLDHGVKIPIEGYDGKVFYVWFDAPIGYVSSTKEATENWQDYWQGDKTEIFNFLGKDNIPFHTIFWPAIVMAQGEFSLPRNVIGLQYLNYEGQKFSKSKNIGVFCETLPNLDIDVDMWRSYLTQIVPESADSEFSWTEFQERINSDLLGNLSNYVNRIVKFCNTKLSGEITKPSEDKLTEEDKKALTSIEEYKDKISKSLESGETRRAWSEVFALCSVGNKYLHDSEPWNVIKEDQKRTNDILYVGTRILKAIAVFASPFIPTTSEKIWGQLGLSGSPSEKGSWEESTKDLEETHKFGEAEILFKKLDEETIDKSRELASLASDLKGFFE